MSVINCFFASCVHYPTMSLSSKKERWRARKESNNWIIIKEPAASVLPQQSCSFLHHDSLSFSYLLFLFLLLYFPSLLIKKSPSLSILSQFARDHNSNIRYKEQKQIKRRGRERIVQMRTTRGGRENEDGCRKLCCFKCFVIKLASSHFFPFFSCNFH